MTMITQGQSERMTWADSDINFLPKQTEKEFNPLEHRGPHGEWESGGEEVVSPTITFLPDFRKRLGLCYKLAGQYVMGHSGFQLVHGSIQGFGNPRIGHAWVITKAGNIWEPATNSIYSKNLFTGFFNPQEDKVYSSQDAMNMMIDHETYGPWDEPAEKAYNPLEHRNAHGEWERSGEELWKSGEGELHDVTPDETEAAKRIWYRNEFSITNDYLRRGIKPSDNPDSWAATGSDDQYDKDIAMLKGMMDRAPRFSKPAVLMRGVATGHEFGSEGSKVGKVFKDKGFMSATASDTEADSYTGNAIIKLHIPAGGKAFRSEPDFFIEGPSDYAAEHEYTIAPGARWRIDSDQPESDAAGWSRRVINVTQLDAKEPGPEPEPHKVTVSADSNGEVYSSEGDYLGFVDRFTDGKYYGRGTGGVNLGIFDTQAEALDAFQQHVNNAAPDSL